MILRVYYPSSVDVFKLEEVADICLKCGVCCVVKGHSCHIQYDERFNAKKTFVYDCLGAEDPVGNPNIWLCVSCHKCEEICPYDVSPLKFIEALKAKAFEQGYTHSVILREVENVLSTGFAFPLTTSTERLRKEFGLEPLNTVAAADLKLIAEETGFAKKLKRAKEGRS